MTQPTYPLEQFERIRAKDLPLQCWTALGKWKPAGEPLEVYYTFVPLHDFPAPSIPEIVVMITLHAGEMRSSTTHVDLTRTIEEARHNLDSEGQWYRRIISSVNLDSVPPTAEVDYIFSPLSTILVLKQEYAPPFPEDND